MYLRVSSQNFSPCSSSFIMLHLLHIGNSHTIPTFIFIFHLPSIQKGYIIMQSINILDIKPFMQLLFQTNTLDSYQFVSATILTDMSYTLDGLANRSFFSEEELSTHDISDHGYLPWSLAKEKVFLLIKGKKTPSQLKIILKANENDTNQLLSSTKSTLKSNDIDGIFLNITFQENNLNVICGISYRIFTMEKELETEFTENIIALFKANNITCE